MSIRQLGVWFLALQAVGAAVWWCVIIGWPAFRAPFMVSGAPDATLLAFAVPDAILFIATSAAAAYGLSADRRWGWPMVCVHSGAASYAALYCWAVTGLTGGDGLLGALLMSPSLIVPGTLVWKLRPGGGAC